MSVTFAQAMAIDALRHGQLLAGRDGLQRDVAYVSALAPMLSAPPGNAPKCALVIASFAELSADAGAQARVIGDLIQRRSAGLICLASPVDVLDTAALSVADAQAFPLYALPSDQTSGEVAAAITAQLLSAQNVLLERAVALHSRLIDLLLRGQGLDALLHTIAEEIGRPALLLTARGKIMADANVDPIAQQAWQRATLRAQPRQAPMTVANAGGPMLQIYPLANLDRCFGWMVLEAHDAEQLFAPLLRHCLDLLTLELMKQELLAATQDNLRRDVLEELLAERWPTDDEAVRAASRVGWDLRPCCAVLIVRAGAMPAEGRARPFLDQIARCLRHISPRSIACPRGDEVLVLVALDAHNATARATHALAEALHAEAAEVGLRSCVIASGLPVKGPAALAASYRMALSALKVREHLPGSPAVVPYEGAELLILLSDLSERPDVRDWVQRHLGTLIDYDRRNRTTLVQTLEIVLDKGGLLNVAAEQLNIHPNTIKYRLQRIEEILQDAPLSSAHRLAYHIATKVARLQAAS